MRHVEDVLPALGVQVTHVSGKEIGAYCPVHHLVKGRADSHPSWSMNRHNGAWICYSCGQSGYLRDLAALLGHDPRGLGQLQLQLVDTQRRVYTGTVEEEEEPEDEGPVIDEYVFDKNPRPPERALARRYIAPWVAEALNLRWDRDGSCWLIPVYDAATEIMLGWQEKSKGYFKNVPDGMKKSRSLFGLHLCPVNSRIAIVESPLDVARMLTAGIQAVATYGVYVSAMQLEALFATTERIVIALDNDTDGKRETAKIWKRIGSRARREVLQLPKGIKDPGEVADDDELRRLFASSVVPYVRG